jgi:hypothetical protein
MLTTLLLPTGGRASVAGHDVVREARDVRRSIGVALQEAALDPLMTGRADELLDRVGLGEAADRRVGDYFPLDLMIEPARTIARYNPLSFIVEGIRGPIISGISAKVTFEAVPAIAAVGGAGLLLSAGALRHRLKAG